MRKLKSIMVIDDSVANNKMVEAIIGQMDITEQVLTYTRVEQAIAYLDGINHIANLPELIFLDIEMGDSNGFQFLDQYIALGSGKTNSFKPLIVMVSDHMTKGKNHDTSKQYQDIGVVEQLKKPLERQDIEDLLEEHKSAFGA